jgi:hypothetical protein
MEEPTSSVDIRRARDGGTPATIERERERKLESPRMTAIHLDLLAPYQGAARDEHP